VILRYRQRENVVVLEIETEIIGIPSVEYVAGQWTKVNNIVDSNVENGGGAEKIGASVLLYKK
jgi:hypothetical protein